ncbi:MAG: hypothetical protein ACUVWP_04020 [bacterium]
MDRNISIVAISFFITISVVFSQQTIKIGDFDVALGGNIRALYTGYMYIGDYYEEHYINYQKVFPEVARFSLTGKYGDHISACFEGGYFNGWAYKSQWEENGDYLYRTNEWFYLGYVEIDIRIFGVTGGLDFVPTGIEPTTRDVDLPFLRT